MKFVPIRLNLLQPSNSREFDIYIMNDTKPLLLLSGSQPLIDHNALLDNNKNINVYIPIKQIDKYNKYIASNLENILSANDISKENRLYAVYISIFDKIDNLVKNNDISLVKDTFQDISNFVLYSMNDSASVSIFLSFIKSDTSNLSNHMINVGIYSSMLTKKLYPEISNKKFEEIARGYFLHDIGMLKIDKNIVSKKDKYTEKEFAEIKKHPIYGVEILEKELKIKSQIIKNIVLEHHERIDGSGYPFGKKNISTFARICSMCDIFDALTSHREYKKNLPQNTFDALKENKEYFVKEFGSEMYASFVKCFSIT